VLDGQHGDDGLDAPRAADEWPVMDFVEETATFRAASLNAFLMASVSILSFSSVEVPCALMYVTCSGRRRASSRALVMACAAPSPCSSGAVMWNASAVMP
jgi:hypothetical protein